MVKMFALKISLCFLGSCRPISRHSGGKEAFHCATASKYPSLHTLHITTDICCCSSYKISTHFLILTSCWLYSTGLIFQLPISPKSLCHLTHSQQNSNLTANMPLSTAEKHKPKSRSPTFDIGLVSANPEVRLQARLRACKTTAENLYHNARAVRLPIDQQTLKDFCFDKLTFDVEKINLLRIYRLLILQMEVSSAELNLWAKEGPPSIGRNIAIEFAHKPDVVPEEYREFFFNNMRIWDLQGNVNLGDHARPARPQRQKNPVVIIIDSGDEGGAESDADDAGIPDEYHQTEQASPVAKKASIPKDNGVESQQTGPKKKATPIPYKPRSQIFKNKRESSSFKPQGARKSGGFKPSKRKRDDSDSEYVQSPSLLKGIQLTRRVTQFGLQFIVEKAEACQDSFLNICCSPWNIHKRFDTL